MTVKNDFPTGSNFATWRFSENAPPGSRKIVLNRHFVLRGSPSAVKPGLTWAGSARRAGLRHRFGGSSRQAGSPSWSTRSGASRGDSANAGSCRSWFDRDGRLSWREMTENRLSGGVAAGRRRSGFSFLLVSVPTLLRPDGDGACERGFPSFPATDRVPLCQTRIDAHPCSAGLEPDPSDRVLRRALPQRAGASRGAGARRARRSGLVSADGGSALTTRFRQKITEIGKKGVCVLPAHRENAWSRSSPSGRAGPRRESRGAVLPISVIFCHKRPFPLPSQRWREPVLGGPEPVLPPVGRRGGPFRPTDRAIRGVGRTSRGAGAHRARRSGPACANPGLTKSHVSRAEPPEACAWLPPPSSVGRVAKGGDAVALRGAWARKRRKTKPEANNRCV